MRGSKTNLDAEYSCKIRLLDDVEISCDFKVKQPFKGQIQWASILGLTDRVSNKLYLEYCTLTSRFKLQC